MMFSSQGSSRNHCNLLAVLCGKGQTQVVSDGVPSFPFPELKSLGRLEVRVFRLRVGIF